MIRSDNHVHSSFSTDSNTAMKEHCKQAKLKKLSSICFTDHMDYEFPEAYSWKKENEDSLAPFTFAPEPYFQMTKEMAEAFPELEIRTGVELGLKKEIKEKALTLTKTYPFDFVIGSTHLVENMDPYYPEYWEAFGEEKGILRYYETTLENIKAGFDFDVYGHIDYILRYCPAVKTAVKKQISLEPVFTKTMSEYAEILREILSLLIQDGKGIEINTAGFKYGLGHPNPHETLISFYKKLGGEIISIGSDAHETEYLGFSFEKVPDILKKTGFSFYTEFHERQPRQIPLA